MARAVLDTTVLVSALLKAVPGGASFDLFLSCDILEEAERVLLTSKRIRARYHYPDGAVTEYCGALANLGTMLTDMPHVRVVRDPADDMILACAIAAKADYLVSRDRDLLVLHEHKGIAVVLPETFLEILRGAT